VSDGREKGAKRLRRWPLKANSNNQSALYAAFASKSQPLTDAKRVRLQYLARRLHALGERPLYEPLLELASSADLLLTLERYTALPAGLIREYGGDRFVPPFIVTDGVAQ
jgi:hypothetical protein